MGNLLSGPIDEPTNRRRRLALTATAVAVILTAAGIVPAAAAAFIVPGSASSPQPAAARNPPVPPPTPLGAPLVEGPDPGSTLLASWGQIHVGYVFVYADGRVIWTSGAGVFIDADNRVTGIPIAPLGVVSNETTIARFWLTESGPKPGLAPGGPECETGRPPWPCPSARFPEGEFRFDINIERQLSPRGLDLVRHSTIAVKHFLVQPDDRVPAKIRRPVDLSRWPAAVQLYLRKELWAEPTARVWEPSKWALSFQSKNDPPPGAYTPVESAHLKSTAVDTTRALEQLPLSAQALLSGKQRTCDPSIGTAPWGFATPAMTWDCFEITSAEFTAFWPMLRPNSSIDELSTWPAWPLEVDERPALLITHELFPHGQPHIWGG